MEKGSSDYGRVVDHADRVLIDDPEFVVQPAGLERLRESGRRNVHAFVRGELVGVGNDATRNGYRSWAFEYRPFDRRFDDMPFVFYDTPDWRTAETLDPKQVLLTGHGHYGLF